MPEALARRLGTHGCVRVSEIVEPKPGQGGARYLAIPIVRESIRLHRLAVLACVNKCCISRPNAKAQQFLSLLHAVHKQSLDHRCRQRHPCALGRARSPSAQN
jgi:hypothetical protein